MLSRKNILSFVISCLLALFIMLTSYLHWLPMGNAHISINSVGVKDEQALASEVRLFYVIVDDEIVRLDTFAANTWKYQGSLVSRECRRWTGLAL